MTFVHISLLAGAALIAVPIVLHLIMRRQPKHLEFPALRFIQLRRDTNRRSLRLRQLLLLLLRCAAICLLALALARPSILASGGLLGDQEAPVAAALVFDTSPRMAYRYQNETRLDAARDTGLWLMEQLPDQSDIAVLDSRTNAAVFAVDPGAARQRIKRLDTHAVAQPLPRVLEEAIRLVAESALPRKEIYVFTDRTRGSWTGPALASLQRRLAQHTDVGIYLIDVGVEEPQNFALDELQLSGQVLSKNNVLHIGTSLSCTGTGGERTVELFLTGNNRQEGSKPADAPKSASPESSPDVERSQETIKLGPGQAQQVDFHLGGLEPGIHQGYVKIAGEDGLASDDRRYFTISVEPAWRVLLVAPAPAADYALFLNEALAPHDLRVKGSAAFQCDVANQDELSRRSLDAYSAVCLIDPAPLPAATWQKLTAYASSGGGVALFLGRNAGSAAAFNDPAALELLPAPLLRQWHAGQREIYLAPDNLEHPLLAKFKPLASSVPWDAFPIFRHWELGKLAEGSAVVIPYSNNLPALLEKPVGEGRVLTLTTPVSDAATRRDLWNTLPTGDEPWPFVMLANEMMYYLVGSNTARLNYLVGDTAVVHLPRDQQHAVYLLSMPEGDVVRQAVDERQRALVITATEVPGNYRARAGGETAGVDLGFSVNLSAGATGLDRASDDDLKSAFGEFPFRVARDRSEIDRNVSAARVGQELYPLLIVLVALVLGGELLLSNRFYRHDYLAEAAREAPRTVAATIEATKREAAEVG